MKKVLIWGMTANWGGIESILYNYVMHSNKEEIVFDFITTFQNIPREEELKCNGSKVVHLAERRTQYFDYRKQLRSYMKQHAKEYSAVWLNDCMFANIDLLKLAKHYGIPKRIIHAHNANSLGGGKSRLIRHKLNTMLLPLYATDYWACSNLAGEWSYPDGIRKGEKYKVISNAIDCAQYRYNEEERKKYRQKLGINENTIVIGHIGRFDYQKNHGYLLKIFGNILKNREDSVLLSIGTGTDFELIKEEAKKMGIAERILFLGQRSDITNLLQAMDIFVLPSQFEGLPVVLVEAMAAGLPCFISDKVTKEAAIIKDLAFFEQIDADPKVWAERIEEVMGRFVRKDTYNEMVQAGFDVYDRANSLHILF